MTRPSNARDLFTGIIFDEEGKACSALQSFRKLHSILASEFPTVYRTVPLILRKKRHNLK
jgi:hypothetical protein